MRLFLLLAALAPPLRAAVPAVPDLAAAPRSRTFVAAASTEAAVAATPAPATAAPAPSAPSETPVGLASERVSLALGGARAADFDGLSLRWGSAPRATVHARNIESLYGLYASGTDALLDKTGLTGPGARLAKAPADVALGWLSAHVGHELGHFEQAWLGGAKDVAYVPDSGPSDLGHIVRVRDWAALSPAARQAFNAGGISATQAAAAQLRRDIFERGEAHWSQWPLLFFQKLDVTRYGLLAPKPSEALADDHANDITNYARRYGERSGRGGEAAHRDIVRGAVWNALDPLGLYAAWGYAGRYVLGGEERQSVPGVELAGRSWTAGTGFWLSEVGARYSLSLLSRGRGGDLLEVTPSGGEGQPGLAVSYSDALAPGWRGRVGVEWWRQREAAEPGPERDGGALELGLRRQVTRSVHVDASAGYKTEGAMLGQPHAPGSFWTLGVGARF